VSPLRSFAGCWERIARAEANIKSFGKLWAEFAAEDHYSSDLEMKDDGTGEISVQPPYSGLPSELSLILGEALYQLRGSLDAAVYSSVSQQTGQDPPPDESVLEFPICASPASFKRGERKLGMLSVERRGFIEEVQPYNVPDIGPDLLVFNVNRTLGILHDWARIDRHRRLHVVGSWASNAEPWLLLPRECRLIELTVHDPSLLESKRAVASFRLEGFQPGMRVNANPNLTIDVAVADGPEPCADNDTLGQRLASMAHAVRVIVGTLEASFPGGTHGRFATTDRQAAPP
jgi:hypothetical protein